MLGTAGQDCVSTCAAVLRPYDTATETYAGSGGTLLNCTGVLTALAGVVPSSGSCSDGLGYAVGSGFLFPDRHCVTPATTAGAANANYQRACACVE